MAIIGLFLHRVCFNIVSIIQLHPLQYSYYNQYVGGFDEAYENYETDYWDVGWPMMDQIARHGLVDLVIVAKGDLHIDAHHTVEDIGISRGEALAEANRPIWDVPASWRK